MVRTAVCGSSAEQGGHIRTGMAGQNPTFSPLLPPCQPGRQRWPHSNTGAETLTGPGHLHLSAGMELRDGRVSWRSKQPSRRRKRIQTSHGSASEASGDAEWAAGTTVALLVPLAPGPPASWRSHFPACGDPGQLAREGITHLRRVCGSRGRKAGFPPCSSLLSHRGGTEFCLAGAGWDRAAAGRRDAARSHGFGTERAGGAWLSKRAVVRWARVCHVREPTLTGASTSCRESCRPWEAGRAAQLPALG